MPSPVKETVQFRVAGRIIEELSEKIPSQLVALNELLKNSYDAFAKEVKVHFDTEKRILTVSDDGWGMTLDQINHLFQISKSEKQYGQKKSHNGLSRICQGSKGLGFLAAFKFGPKVTWQTKSENPDQIGYKFCLDKTELTNLDSLTDFPITVNPWEAPKKGTIIQIELDDYSFKELHRLFNNEEQYKKVLESFLDKNFKILFLLDDLIIESADFVSFRKQSRKTQLCSVQYNSSDSHIVLDFSGRKHSVVFPVSSSFKIDLNLIFYNFSGTNKKKEGISSLFYRTNDSALTPLLYINDVFFNNFSLFNPDINRSKGNSLSFPQQVGYINIRSQDPNLEFNSDRTNLVRNALTDEISNSLSKLNSKIQESIAKYKNVPDPSEKPSGTSSNPKKPSSKKKGKADSESNNNASKNIGSPSTAQSGVACIELTQSHDYRKVNSEQINLYGYVSKAIDSNNQPIPFENISLVCNGIEMKSHILESQPRATTKDIVYSFNDAQTGRVASNLYIEFRELPTPKAEAPSIIPTRKEHEELFKQSEELKQLVLELNQLAKVKVTKSGLLYPCAISCSLRSVLELALEQFTDKNIGPSEQKLKSLFKFYKDNHRAMSKLYSYHTVDKFISMVEPNQESLFAALHLGAHKSYTFLTETRLFDAGRDISIIMLLIAVAKKANLTSPSS